MEVNNHCYKLSYDEALIALTGINIYQQDNLDQEEDIKRVTRLITNSIAASRLIISARIQYTHNIDPTKEEIDECCHSMHSTFISIPKDNLTSSIIPRSIESYASIGYDNPQLIEKNKIDKATDMILLFMLDDTNSTD